MGRSSKEAVRLRAQVSVFNGTKDFYNVRE